jgi:hypothetical protein
LSKAENGGRIIKNSSGVNDLQQIGKINKELYSKINKDISTDELIITDKQIEHINQRHPGVYDKYKNQIIEIVNNPDYIFKDKKENTALVVKQLEGNVELVLRLMTDKDTSYKNSIITMWEISDSRLRNYIRNSKIVYSKNN